MKILKFVICTILFSTAVLPQNSKEENPAELKKKISQLEQVSNSLYSLHEQLSINSKTMFDMNAKAQQDITNTLLQTYLKGSLEILDKVTSPTNSALELANEVILNLTAEPGLWKEEDKFTFFKEMNKASYYRNTKIRLMYSTIGILISYPLERFDNDNQPLSYTKPWWGNPDQEKDDNLELKIRKTNIIKNLSEKIYQRTEEELQKIRNERSSVIKLINELKEQLPDNEDKEELKPETDNSPKGKVYTNDRGESEDLMYRRPTAEEIAAAKKRNPEIIKTEIKEEKSAEQIEKENNAEVYIDSDCERHVHQNEMTVMIAKAHPEDIKGIFVLFVDDVEYARSQKPSNTFEFIKYFNESGVFDVQVKLYIDDRYIDTYTDQFYVDPATYSLEALENKFPYPAEKEGTKEERLSLPYAKYYTSYTGGKIYLEGYYYTPTGKKIDYKSEPISPAVEKFAEKGLMLTKSMTGYHFYQTVGGDNKTKPYIVTRMRGENIEIINRFNAAWINVVPAADLSTIVIEYKENANGIIEKIVLN